MNSFKCLGAAALLMVACGKAENTESHVASDRFLVGILGIELSNFSQQELKKFAAGENVDTISGKLPVNQQTELRESLTRVIKIPASQLNALVTTDAGKEVHELIGRIVPGQYTEENLNTALRTSVADDQMTLLELLCAYPSQELKVNGLELVSKKDKLRTALLKLEEIAAH